MQEVYSTGKRIKLKMIIDNPEGRQRYGKILLIWWHCWTAMGFVDSIPVEFKVALNSKTEVEFESPWLCYEGVNALTIPTEKKHPPPEMLATKSNEEIADLERDDAISTTPCEVLCSLKVVDAGWLEAEEKKHKEILERFDKMEERIIAGLRSEIYDQIIRRSPQALTAMLKALFGGKEERKKPPMEA
jgi:hypothetical protein